MDSKSAVAPRSLLIRFFDNFLQERNIKWMLALGMLILLGSSVLLVSAHWETCTPVWKYLIFLAYTAAIFAAGEWTRHRLLLVKTGTGLQVLTVLLLPITFLVLHWVHRQGAHPVGLEGIDLVLLGLNFGLSAAAAGRIFHHFLRGWQPTFLASYLILALAGAIVPGLPEAWAPVTALALWAVFAAGAIKVNRHVFWLIEERRAPRVFGFFPIILLGAQFLTLFALHAPWTIALNWLGFGCILVAIPVLFCADAVARVFQQRTGDLVRPLPWAIVGPLGLGLVLCAAGVCLAGMSLVPPQRPIALVLSAGLAAVLMALVARRTGKQAFVWAMLFCVTLTYNFSPAFFADLARHLVTHAAHAVHEASLPYAFYGLTYLPLLLIAMAASRKLARAGNDLFARPLRHFAIGMSCLLLVVAVGHAKAMFPVALCMALVFAVQVLAFREGRLALPAIAAWIIAAAGFAPFAEGVLQWTLPAHCEFYCLSVAAALLLIAGHRVDGFLERLLPASFGQEYSSMIEEWRHCLCQGSSLVLALGLSGFWLAQSVFLPLSRESWPVPAALGILLIVQAFFQRRPEVRVPLFVLLNWQVLSLAVVLFGPQLRTLIDVSDLEFLPVSLPLALISAASLCLWQGFDKRQQSPWREVVFAHLCMLRYLAVFAMFFTLQLPSLEPIQIVAAAAVFALAALAELCSACRQQRQERVWIAQGVVAAAAAYFAYFEVVSLGRGFTMFVLLGLGFAIWLIGEWAQKRGRLAILAEPLQRTALAMPLATVALGIFRHFHAVHPAWLGANSLALLLAAGFYFWRGLERPSKSFLILAGVILNVALALLWRELAWTDPQFFMIPVGMSILVFVQLLKEELPERFHDPLRYLGALVILVSPTFHIVAGSWIHLFSLMVVSVGVVLVAIGLRVRALMYTGTAFLVADLAAMVVRGSIDDPNILWIAGLALGAAVIVLGAICERNREALLDRMRVLSEALKQWE